MALKTAKRAGEYKLCFSGDPALKLPEDPGPALIAAWDTGNWDDLIDKTVQPGPTMFKMRPLGTELLTLWRAWKDPHGNELWDSTPGWMLLGRLALIDVEGMDDLKVERGTADPHFGETWCADSKLFDRLEDPKLAIAIQVELGKAVLHRETITRGKS